jgi:predicted RNA binding protein YcfA (HicA-like mRNA interferase family)
MTSPSREASRPRRIPLAVHERASGSANTVRKYREVRDALRQAGWEVLRQRGSDEVWGRPDEAARIVVAGKDSQTVPIGTLSSIRKASGLEHLR